MSTLYSVGQMNQVGDALESAGFTPAEVDALRKFDLNQIRFVLSGQAKIVAIPEDKWRQGKKKKILKPFISIQTGNTTAEKLIADIKANKNKNNVADEVTEYASSMMANFAFTVSAVPGTADLVSISIGELGFTENPQTIDVMTADFCAQWSAENLTGYAIELCQPEDGPQLRKQWLDQPKDSAVWMAMERITDSGGGPRVFSVGCDSDVRRWLLGGWARPDDRWCLGSRIVFRLRKIT